MFYTVIVAWALIALMPPPVPAEEWSQEDATRDQTGEIYRIVLRKYVGTDQTVPTRFVVRATASDSEIRATNAVAGTIHGMLGDTEAELVRNFMAKLREGGPPRQLDRVGAPVTIIADGEFDAELGSEDEAQWTRFREAYPGAAGITTLSHVGFSNDGRKAMVYIATHRGGIHAEGQIVMLTFDGTWTIKTAFHLWQA